MTQSAPSTPAPVPSAPRGPQRAPSYLQASLRIFDLSLGQMLWSRRTIFLGLVVGSPLALGVLFRILEALGLGSMQIENVKVPGPSIYGGMIWLLYLRFMVPVLGVFYGTALMADEVDDKTLTYLFVRPIPRGAIILGKYLAYLVTTVFVVLPSVVILYFLVVPLGHGSLASSFPALVTDLGLLALGLAAYGALFTLAGARLKHPLVTGLVFAFGWEQLALALPGYLRRFTLAYYLQSLVPHAMPQEGLGSLLQSVFRDVPAPLAATGWLVVFIVVFLALAAWIVERREYVLEQ